MARFRVKPWMLLAAVLVFLVIAFFGTFYIAAPERQSTAVEGIAGAAVTPAVTGIGGFASSIRDFIDRLFGLRDVDKEYEQLKIRVQQLEIANQILQDSQLEYERMTELLGFREKYPNYIYLHARVIAKDRGSWFFYFDLNRGSDDGVEKMMMVVNELGLVGTVIDVKPNSCKVMAIIDRMSKISVVLERSRDHGMAHGSGDPYSEDPTCELYYLPIGSEVVPGNRVVTSDFDGASIKGLPVGTILSVSRDPKLQRFAQLIPYVDFAHLENVLIITGEKAPPAEGGEDGPADGQTAGPGDPSDAPEGSAPPDTAGQTAAPGEGVDGGQEEGN